MEEIERAEFEKFKAVNFLYTSNLVCFDPEGRLRRYPSSLAILDEFYHLRLHYYKKRKVTVNLFRARSSHIDIPLNRPSCGIPSKNNGTRQITNSVLWNWLLRKILFSKQRLSKLYRHWASLVLMTTIIY